MLPHKVLITTSDYLPKFGGLTTYALNLESVLREIYSDVELFHWKSIKELKAYEENEKYDLIFNVHMMASYFGNWDKKKNINFIHGSEVLFYSPNFLKRLYKRIFQRNILQSLESSRANIFISEFTMKKTQSFGLDLDYSRDYVVHNCIDTVQSEYCFKSIRDEISFTFFSRNVPHKNPSGVGDLLKNLSKKYHDKEIVLHTNVKGIVSDVFITKYYDKLSNEKREELYKISHFNLLLSLDHSHRGFFEGFGLTCLEAGKYGVPSIVNSTGGLPENVHHKRNGYVLEGNDLFDFNLCENYKELCEFTHAHTLASHDLSYFKRFITAYFGETFE